MIVRHSRPQSTLPSADGWKCILLGLSKALGLDPRHTLLCNLGRLADLTRGVPLDQAQDFVEGRIVAHVHGLALELGLDRHYADGLAMRLAQALKLIRLGIPYEAYLPTRAEWLAIDRGAAFWVGMDGDYTLSTNLASFVAGRLGWTHHAAKRWVHSRIAHRAQLLARDLGFAWLPALQLKWRLEAWLNSFDR